MRVLLVEDEVRLTDALEHLLKQQKIDVDIANDGLEGMILAERNLYDVIVLDIMLPGKSGLDILKNVRNKGNKTPILLLTARDTVEDKVKGLDMGADDYLVKPFATSELLARIRALYRRIPAIYTGDKLYLGNIELDANNMMVAIENEVLKLSTKEVQLLELFLRRPGQIFSKEQILDRVWGYDAQVNENNIEIHVHNLRKKLENKTSVSIVTIRGVGYTLKEV